MTSFARDGAFNDSRADSGDTFGFAEDHFKLLTSHGPLSIIWPCPPTSGVVSDHVAINCHSPDLPNSLARRADASAARYSESADDFLEFLIFVSSFAGLRMQPLLFSFCSCRCKYSVVLELWKDGNGQCSLPYRPKEHDGSQRAAGRMLTGCRSQRLGRLLINHGPDCHLPCSFRIVIQTAGDAGVKDSQLRRCTRTYQYLKY